MIRAVVKSLTSATVFLLLAAGGTAGVWYYQQKHAASYQIQRLEQQVEIQKQKLQEEKQHLQTVVQRLSDERRVAEILVTGQRQTEQGLETSLLFVEYSRDGGSSLPPRQFTIRGNSAHIDAMVIKFERDYVAQNDPLRGHSIALFTRLYGDDQSPSQAFRIDEPGEVPAIYRGDMHTTAAQAAFEQDLWRDFWRLADDKAYRGEKGVRVANGQGVWGPFQPEKLYTITLDADGGLNLASEPMKPIYRELIKQHAPAPVNE